VFRGKNAWLWDRAKGRARLRAGDREILFRTHDRTGVAFEDGRPLSGEALDDALAGAWKAFCNDTFWLNPLVKLFDDGTRRALRADGGRPRPAGQYGSGGVTPGDAYLWHGARRPPDRLADVGADPPGRRRPHGVEGWQTLETGAVVSTLHKGAIADLALTEVAGGATLDGLEPGAFDRLGPR
jgi:hypothetical protein